MARVLTAVRRNLGNRNLVIGTVVLLLFLAVSILGPTIAPMDPLETNIGNTLKPPSADHLLGTDRFGRDIYSRLLYGARTSLIVGAAVVSLSLVGGVLLGTLAGYFGRAVDRVLSFVIDSLLAFPGFLLALALVAVAGSNLRSIIIAVSIAYVPRIAVVMRAVVQSVRNNPYIDAAVASGVSQAGIVVRHVLPNSLPPVIVVATVSAALAILAEAGLSFLGLGVQPPEPTWGNIIRDGLPYIVSQPWISLIGGLAVAVSVIGLNMLGDGLRDLLDPHMQQATKMVE